MLDYKEIQQLVTQPLGPTKDDERCAAVAIHWYSRCDETAEEYWSLTGRSRGEPGPTPFEDWAIVEQRWDGRWGFVVPRAYCSEEGWARSLNGLTVVDWWEGVTDRSLVWNGNLVLIADSNGWSPEVFERSNPAKFTEQWQANLEMVEDLKASWW